MDEYYCEAYADIQVGAFSSVSEFGDQCFNVEVEFERTGVFNLKARKFHTPSVTTRNRFFNVPRDEIMQENTIVRWLYHMGVPEDARAVVVPKILKCAHDMATRTHKHQNVLSMRVVVAVPWLSEEDDDDFEEEDEEDSMEEDEDDDNFEDNEGEDEEDFMVEDQDHGLVPAAKSCIEELVMEKVEQGRCAICFEDFNVGARMPCLHMFHRNCIVDWLQIGNSCPLCRFPMPTSESE